MTKPLHPAQLLFTEDHPLTASLNMEFSVPSEGQLWVHLKASDIYADEAGKNLHTGFNALLLDTVMGACAIGELKQLQPIATIKLNCNNLRQAEIGESLICKAVHDGLTNEVIYVHGEIYSEDRGDTVSNAIGTFMMGTATKSIRGKSQ